MSKSELFETQKIIDEINLDSIFAYEQIFATFLYLNHLNFPALFLKSGSIFWRTRNNTKNPFSKFSDLSCPDESLIHNYSRANKPHQSMFYLSEYFDTTFLELMPSWSSQTLINNKLDITISNWELKKDLFVMCIPEKTNPYLKYFFKKGFSKNEMRFLNWIINKFSSNIIETPNVYKFTSALCNVFLTRKTKQKIWGILYPSVHRKNQQFRIKI